MASKGVEFPDLLLGSGIEFYGLQGLGMINFQREFPEIKFFER